MERARYCLAAAVLLSACCAHKPKLPPPGSTPPGTAGQGLIWLNQHDLVLSDSERIALSTNGTVVFVGLKAGVSTPFLDPANGTISADTGVQLGDQDDRIAFMAIGLRYDSTCTPN